MKQIRYMIADIEKALPPQFEKWLLWRLAGMIGVPVIVALAVLGAFAYQGGELTVAGILFVVFLILVVTTEIYVLRQFNKYLKEVTKRLASLINQILSNLRPPDVVTDFLRRTGQLVKSVHNIIRLVQHVVATLIHLMRGE